MKRAVVFGGGQIKNYSLLPYEPSDDDYFICADSGILHCESMGLCADVWVGDFDSCDFKNCVLLPAAKKAEVISLNPQKDCSDVEYALDYAVRQGFDTLILIGGMGTRFDHTLSNLYLAEKYYNSGVSLTVINESNIINFVKNQTFSICKTRYKYISVLPLEDSVVSTEGLFYEISREPLYRNSTRSISNEMTGNCATITLHSGSAFVIESMD